MSKGPRRTPLPAKEPAAPPCTTANIAERKRLLVREELVDAAMRLLAQHGFHETTVDQIAATAGMSRRTFSRYFESKEDVVVHSLAEAGTRLLTELRARPVDESAAMALRHAFSTFGNMCMREVETSLRVSRLILETPPLLARFLERQSYWRDSIATILAERERLDRKADFRPELAAAVALAAFHTMLLRWVRSDGKVSMHLLLDEAFAAIAPTLDCSMRKR